MKFRRYGLRLKEVKGHAIVLVVILWALGIVNCLSPGPRLLSGPMKGADFVHFYTLGSIVASGRPAHLLYDMDALHAVQSEVVPGSDDIWYFPVYGPQTALLFAPFARVPYLAGAFLWACVTIGLYAAAFSLALRGTDRLGPYTTLVWLAAFAFPPFWQLVFHGQTTIISLLAFVGAWLALEHKRPFLAGLMVGLLALKPQLGLVVAVLLVASRSWKIILGAMASISLQAGAVVLVLGTDALRAYLAMMKRLRVVVELLEPRPYQMHSIRGFLDLLLPDAVGWWLWVLTSAVIVFLTYRVWTAALPLTFRFAALLVSTVLVSPHLTVYDATLLAPALLWYADFLVKNRPQPGPDLTVIYALFACYLVPTALVVPIQISVIVLAYLGWRVFVFSKLELPTVDR